MRTILLTGATGFLGSTLTDKLLKSGYKVIILKRSFSDTRRLANLMDFIKAFDIDKTGIEQAFESQKIDVVIHTATNYGRQNQSASEIIEDNLVFPVKLLEASIKFNTDTFFNTDTSQYNYLNYYTLSKKQFKEWGVKSCFNKKTDFINVKLEHIYGPNDSDKKFVTWFAAQLIKGSDIINLTEGKQKRDFIFIDDVASAYCTLLESDLGGFNEFEVGTGESVELRDFLYEIVECYEEITGRKSLSKLNFGAINYREGEPMAIRVHNSALLALGWKPRFTSKTGIRLMLESILDDLSSEHQKLSF